MKNPSAVRGRVVSQSQGSGLWIYAFSSLRRLLAPQSTEQIAGGTHKGLVANAVHPPAVNAPITNGVAIAQVPIWIAMFSSWLNIFYPFRQASSSRSSSSQLNPKGQLRSPGNPG